MRFRSLLFFVLFFPFSTSASDWSSAENYVELLQVQESGIYVQFSHKLDGGCASTTWIQLPNTEALDRLYSALLSAYHSGSKIMYRVSGCIDSYSRLEKVRFVKNNE